MFKKYTSLCPICKCVCVGEEEKHRHIEEAHNNVMGKDEELMEVTKGREILNEHNN